MVARVGDIPGGLIPTVLEPDRRFIVTAARQESGDCGRMDPLSLQQSVEVEEFSLGSAPPQMGSTKTYWSNDAKGMVRLRLKTCGSIA
jgi:hypothetical protein